VARLADEARSLARALAWHDIRLNYEAIADSYEQLAQSAGELARLQLDYGGTADVATTIVVSPGPPIVQLPLGKPPLLAVTVETSEPATRQTRRSSSKSVLDRQVERQHPGV